MVSSTAVTAPLAEKNATGFCGILGDPPLALHLEGCLCQVFLCFTPRSSLFHWPQNHPVQLLCTLATHLQRLKTAFDRCRIPEC